jgi:endonuclease/exonuclease/phosphatase family metal-dependent hydrolase
VGVLLGAAIDVAIRLGYATVDLPWTNHPSATWLAIGLAISAIGSARLGLQRVEAVGEVAWLDALPLLGLGAWLGWYLLLSGNPSQMMARTETGFGVAAMALAVGHAAAARLAAGASAHPTLIPGLGVLAAVALLGSFPLWAGWPLSPLWMLLSAASADLLLVACSWPSGGPIARASATTTAVVIGASFALFLGVAYVSYGLLRADLALLGSALGLGLAALAGIGRKLFAPPPPLDLDLRLVNLVAFILIAVAGYRAIGWREQASDQAAPLELTLMTYNVQGGFGADGRWDLERTARTIEAAAPDVVVLQEVTRGWLIGTGADEALWLSRRLRMPMVFGPAAGDLHGNLLLSKYEVEGAGERYEAAWPGSLTRGFISARLATEHGPLTILATHLDHPAEAGRVRLEQIQEALQVLGSERPALLAGDLNAEASSPEVQAALLGGLADAPAAVGLRDATWPTAAPMVRIDHVLTTTDIGVVSGSVERSIASDHLPVVVRIRLP